MTRTLHARYDGEALHPEEPLPISPETRVLIVVDTGDDQEHQPVGQSAPVKGEPYSFLRYAETLDLEESREEEERSRVEDEGSPYAFLEVLRSLHLEGPPDWSQRVNDYRSGPENPGND